MERTKTAFAGFRSGRLTMRDLSRSACQDIVEHLGVTRASVWTFTPQQDAIEALALLDKRTGGFEDGAVLRESDFEPYFRAIRKERFVLAPDAATHPATQCFNTGYFGPNDIRSLLDYIIYGKDQPIAILCCEHCGEIREWSGKDMNYLHGMALTIGIAFERS